MGVLPFNFSHTTYSPWKYSSIPVYYLHVDIVGSIANVNKISMHFRLLYPTSYWSWTFWYPTDTSKSAYPRLNSLSPSSPISCLFLFSLSQWIGLLSTPLLKPATWVSSVRVHSGCHHSLREEQSLQLHNTHCCLQVPYLLTLSHCLYSQGSFHFPCIPLSLL